MRPRAPAPPHPHRQQLAHRRPDPVSGGHCHRRSGPRAAPADTPTRSPDRGRHRPADCSAACRSSRRRPDCGRATICRTALVYGAACQPRQGQNPRQPGHAGLPHLHTASARGSVSEGVPARSRSRKLPITRPGDASAARSHPVTDLAGFTPRPRPAHGGQERYPRSITQRDHMGRPSGSERRVGALLLSASGWSYARPEDPDL